MIIVKLEGGLGNQLFQYALGRALSERHNTELKLDLSWYKNHPYRSFELDNFNIEAEIASEDDLQSFLSPIAKIIDRFRKPQSRRRIFERTSLFDERILELPDERYLVGHWHSERYFKTIEHRLRKEITLKGTMTRTAREWQQKIEKAPKSVSLHVRRGDYVSNAKFQAVHGNLSDEYYAEALKVMQKRKPDMNVFIFSDDIEWTKDHFKLPLPTHFVHGPDLRDVEALVLMSRCTDNIIANSSFSWWGAWLNPNPMKVVIAPSVWFANSPKDTRDFLPDAWTKI